MMIDEIITKGCLPLIKARKHGLFFAKDPYGIGFEKVFELIIRSQKNGYVPRKNGRELKIKIAIAKNDERALVAILATCHRSALANHANRLKKEYYASLNAVNNDVAWVGGISKDDNPYYLLEESDFGAPHSRAAALRRIEARKATQAAVNAAVATATAAAVAFKLKKIKNKPLFQVCFDFGETA